MSGERWKQFRVGLAQPLHRAQRRPRRGAIFILALGVIVVATGLLLVFAQSMRVEALSSANRLSYVKVDAVEQGAERWALAQTESYAPDAITLCQLPAEAIQVGDAGYFWLLQFNNNDESTYSFGLNDESSKLNLNTTPGTRLFLLPNMTQAIADAIQDWRSPAGSATSDGAESSYYNAIGYNCKNSGFETVEESLLVRDVTKDLLFGYDLNRNGIIDPSELAAEGDNNLLDSGDNADRGWFNYLTVYSSEPNTSSTGGKRVNVNAASTTTLTTLFTKAISASRATQILARLRPSSRPGAPPPQYANIGTFYTASGMTAAEFALVVDHITTSTATTLQGMVNINTAPKPVLMCLPGLVESDADLLITSRSSSDLSSIGWVFNALSGTKAAGISSKITSRSFVYSADIVAVSADGRAFKRVRIVIDAQKTPAKIIYRRDLTSAGWPLPESVRSDLRSGKPAIATGASGIGLPGIGSQLP